MSSVGQPAARTAATQQRRNEAAGYFLLTAFLFPGFYVTVRMILPDDEPVRAEELHEEWAPDDTSPISLKLRDVAPLPTIWRCFRMKK